VSALTPESFEYVRDLVYRRSGIVLEAGKEYLVEARLTPVARQEGIASLEELTARVRKDERGRVATILVEAMTTNETSFFRDIHPFEALTEKVIPDLIKARAASRTLNIWCAAASTGQEPYTIAMLIKEKFPQLEGWNVQITSTDINSAVLARARAGVFRQLEVNRGLPAPMLLKHFTRVGAEWSVASEIRSMVEFKQLNLVAPTSPFPPADIVFLRNVLIYFDDATRGAVLRRVRAALPPDGYLFLGCAETTASADDAYERVQIGAAACHRPRTKA